MFKRIIALILLSIIYITSFPLSARAFSITDIEGTIGGYYLYNFENDMVIAQDSIDKKIPASSTVKLMTAYVALNSDIPLDSVITITNDMLIGVSGRFMGLKAGDTLTFADLLYATVNASFNDAALAVSYTVSGSNEKFVNKMNECAKDLGMADTYYCDSTGMNSSSYTTIRDMLKLIHRLINDETYMIITDTKTYIMSDHATCDYTKIANRSSLLSSYKGFHNFNVGSTDVYGDCAVSYLNNGKTSFLCIVMNAVGENNDNFAEACTKKLIDHGLYDFSFKTVLKSSDKVTSISTKLSISDNELNVYPQNDVNVFLSDNSDDLSSLSINYYLYDAELKAPIKSGDEVGMLTVSKNGKLLASTKLIVTENVQRNSFLYMIELMKEYISGRAFVISIISFFILSSLFYYYKTNKLSMMYKGKLKLGSKNTLKKYFKK